MLPASRLKRLILVLALLAFTAIAVLISPFGLRQLGQYLVHSDPPCHADVIVVLAGDVFCHRLERAAELVKQGYAPRVLVDSPGRLYGVMEGDLAIAEILKEGYPAAWFTPVAMESMSTTEEVAQILPELNRQHVRSFMVVTSNFHTRRSGAIFAAAHPRQPFCVVAARDQYFHPENWWKLREARKTFLMEWMKTVANWFGGG